MEKIKIAIVGIGNCASSLIQGIHYYDSKKSIDPIGLMNYEINGYKPSDIEVVAAFDVDKRKVGYDLSEAIFAKPNCTKVFCEDIPELDVVVSMGKVLDGISEHMKEYNEDSTFVLSDEKEKSKKEIVQILKESKAEILLNYLPVGSEEATKFYADCALESNLAFINNIPVFIASDPVWEQKFKDKGLPLIGDDIKAQLGATITHRVLADLFNKRGVYIDRTYQINTGGNTDFLNMLNRNRLYSKKISKTDAVISAMEQSIEADNIHVGPSDYVPWQNDNKVCFMRFEGRMFGDVELNLELRLSVEDSPNSAGVVIDAIRCCKIALVRGEAGVINPPSSYFYKHPPIQINDSIAKDQLVEYIG